MDLVVDANVLFAALIKDGLTAELLVDTRLKLHAPHYLIEEFKRYEQAILDKTHRDPGEFKAVLDVIMDRIEFVASKEFHHLVADAREICPDPADYEYVALAMHIDAPLWSNDSALLAMPGATVVSTTELVRILPKNI